MLDGVRAIRGKRLAALAITCVLVAIALCAPAAASAKTVTLTKTFTLRSNTTASYVLPGKATTVADAGYVLSGPDFSVREDNLVDPYPHQPHDVGQITKGAAKVIAVGLQTHGFGFQVRVKTGKLSGVYRLKLYLKFPS